MDDFGFRSAMGEEGSRDVVEILKTSRAPFADAGLADDGLAEDGLACDETAGALEIGRSIDLDRHTVNERHVDAHAVLKRPQLLELFAPLQGRRPQRHEPL